MRLWAEMRRPLRLRAVPTAEGGRQSGDGAVRPAGCVGSAAAAYTIRKEEGRSVRLRARPTCHCAARATVQMGSLAP